MLIFRWITPCLIALIVIVISASMTQIPAVAQMPQECGLYSSGIEINFGHVDMLSGGVYDQSTIMKAVCRGNIGDMVYVCFHLTGNDSPIEKNMTLGVGKLEYDLFSDSGYTRRFGSQYGAQIYRGGPVPVEAVIGHNQAMDGIETRLYARLDTRNQREVIPGIYQATISGTRVWTPDLRVGITYGFYGYNGVVTRPDQRSCNGIAMPGGLLGASSTLAITAEVTAGCSVTTHPLRFGNVGSILNGVNASSRMVVRCTRTTPYIIRMSDGNAMVDGVRGMVKGSDRIAYGLYRDAGCQIPWTLVNRIGTGEDETIELYGRVPPQTTPPAGSYSDVVVITVVYG